MTTSSVAKITSGLLVCAGVLTLLLVSLDKIIWSTAVSHAASLIVFGIIDLAGGGLLLLKKSKLFLKLAVLWSALRIVVWFGDLLTTPIFGVTYTSFANYLYNPINTTPPNPPGIPGALVDVIIILEILAVLFAYSGVRESSTSTS